MAVVHKRGDADCHLLRDPVRHQSALRAFVLSGQVEDEVSDGLRLGQERVVAYADFDSAVRPLGLVALQGRRTAVVLSAVQEVAGMSCQAAALTGCMVTATLCRTKRAWPCSTAS